MTEDFDISQKHLDEEEFTGMEGLTTKERILFITNKFLPTNIETDLCCGFAVGIIILVTGLILLIAIIVAIGIF